MLPETFQMTNELFTNYTYIICVISALVGFIVGRIPSRWFKKSVKTHGDHVEG